ncbi:O-linked N-acetylglucosamine transferase, SPINDLY family protein [Nostocaceae cyanobacterium CENA357]|uniref:O-linked N-acetylglucosamine transferase, SPINDLY family protein n=1 Tax=Atlanticothrix silvestris CENA357 TaxID=1725252 RepID=A0A8J7L4A2_9CYAN|nr:O-linked N-acetylglucosamine transferase, SPINDLY family protein [Atlanticothrix silvestris]MBH8554591.1 O-linked N-acetylglucosamine transferase, SPINDLY family protein [Atlanticothrix silvestris CENA357]
MNKSAFINPQVNYQQKGYELLLQGIYLKAAGIYEQAITAEPDVKSHYWYLGLIFLLQGQELEAKTTWLMAIMEDEAEEVSDENAELKEILKTEAERQERLEEYSLAWKIRQSIKELFPKDVHNLLHLVQLAIEAKTYKSEDLEEYRLIEILQSEPKLEVNLELLTLVLRSILDYAYLESSSIDLVEASLPYFADNLQTLRSILIPAAVDIAYSHGHSDIARSLAELYLNLDPENKEFLGHLTAFYQNEGKFDLGIKTAKLFYSLVDSLAEKIFANRQILRGLISAGGYWEESCAANRKQQDLIAQIIKENPQDLDQIKIVRLLGANYFAPYIEDNLHENKKIQNQILKLCNDNTAVYAQKQVEKYSQGHLQRKQQSTSNKKLKIGYISYCLRTHSVGWLARWIFQHHDRDKFQINGYFMGADNMLDFLHQWYIDQVDQAYKSTNVWSMAEQIYQDEIDILIDLDSITLDTTCEVVQCKPAPIQATWLGWDASGSPSVDYFIADPYVLPESAQEHYREKIWRLPQTYIAVDGFEVGVPTVHREQLDIPSDGVVYFCGQRGFKRHPDITKLQLRILKEVPNSYFLIKGISSNEESVKAFFYQLAEAEGVDSSKFRFLPGVPSESIHRANLGIADIVLDTYPYNGATTTLETLWMCIPMVTKVGEQFAARNSYTMMMNAGVTEGIAWTDEEYVEWGVRLGKDEALRQQISWKLKQSRKTSPLWNGKQFTREMENAYTQMWQKYISS